VGGVSSTDRLFLYLSAVWAVWKLSAIGNPKSLQNLHENGVLGKFNPTTCPNGNLPKTGLGSNRQSEVTNDD
jgi:hypothetical protein